MHGPDDRFSLPAFGDKLRWGLVRFHQNIGKRSPSSPRHVFLDLDAIEPGVADDAIGDGDPFDIGNGVRADANSGAMRAKDAVTDDYVEARRAMLSGFEGNAVVRAGNITIGDENILAAIDVDAVVVGPQPAVDPQPTIRRWRQ